MNGQPLCPAPGDHMVQYKVAGAHGPTASLPGRHGCPYCDSSPKDVRSFRAAPAPVVEAPRPGAPAAPLPRSQCVPDRGSVNLGTPGCDGGEESGLLPAVTQLRGPLPLSDKTPDSRPHARHQQCLARGSAQGRPPAVGEWRAAHHCPAVAGLVVHSCKVWCGRAGRGGGEHRGLPDVPARSPLAEAPNHGRFWLQPGHWCAFG